MKCRLKHIFALSAMIVFSPLSAQANDAVASTSAMNADIIMAFNTISDAAPQFQPRLWISMDKQDPDFNNLIQNHAGVFVDFANKFINEFSIHSIAYKLNNTPIAEIAYDLKHPIEDVQNFMQDFEALYDKRQYKNNCYSYAVNDIYGEDHYAGGKPFPGENTLYKKSSNFRYSPHKLEHIVTEGVKADGLLSAGTTLPQVKEGYYRVALMMNGEEDFHWIREDQSGLWSGKRGHHTLHTTDIDGTPITNPDKANFGDYKMAKYFYVPAGGINLQKDIRPPYNQRASFEQKK